MKSIEWFGSRRAILVELRDARGQKERPGVANQMNEFLKSPLGGALLTLIFTTILGGAITHMYTTSQERIAAKHEESEADRSRRHERLEASLRSRKELVDTTAQMLTARRMHSALLRSAIENGARLKEVEARWADYQRAYADFNLQLFPFRAAALSHLGEKTQRIFSGALEKYISRSFGRIDDCLSKAYYLYARGKSARAGKALSSCSSRAGVRRWSVGSELDKQLSCITSFEIELASSIYIENNFDKLPDDQRGRPTNPLPDLKSCVDTLNWVCIRLHNRAIVKEKLDESCAALDDRNY